jgi:MoaA/NifB/PqqE/SkfB family radical SAM enzyme
MIFKAARLGWKMLLGRPILCLWQVTGRCHFSCRICDFWRDVPESDLDLEACTKIVRGLRPVAPLMLSLAGGEPLLRSDLPELVGMASRDHFCTVITNGWLMTREMARRLWGAGLRDAVVSIDYATPELHDRQRGKEGAFSRAVAALEHLHETRPDRRHKVRINTVVMDDNLGELEGLLLLAEELSVSLSFTLYSDRLGKKANRLPTTPVSDYLLELKRRHSRHLDSPTAYLASFDRAVAPGIPDCRGGQTFMNINPQGQVSRCIDRNDQPLANLLVANPKQARTVLKSMRHADCQACWTACRALGDISTGRPGLAAWGDNLRARRSL